MNNEGEQKPWKRRVRHELFNYWTTVLYLAVYFGAFTNYRRLILARYEISYFHYGFAIVQALVLAKVILIGELLRLGRGLENRPLYVPTLFQTVMFMIWVAVFRMAEETITGLLQGHGWAAGFNELIMERPYEFLASCVVVFVTFVPFFAFKQINEVLGPGKLWSLFFRKPPLSEDRSPSANQESPNH
jgi:hypothetical protein